MRLTLSFLIATCIALPASAHHGWGSYDPDNPMTIEGTIEEVALQNPHGEMIVLHEGDSWLITLAPLSRMNARGATADILQTGTIVVAYGYPKRDGSPEIRAEWIAVNGQQFQLR
jgi:Family of unknown function (DUF6152)